MIEQFGFISHVFLLGLQISIGFAPYIKNEYRGNKI